MSSHSVLAVTAIMANEAYSLRKPICLHNGDEQLDAVTCLKTMLHFLRMWVVLCCLVYRILVFNLRVNVIGRGGTFIFSFQISQVYPHEAPKVKCKTKVRATSC